MPELSHHLFFFFLEERKQGFKPGTQAVNGIIQTQTSAGPSRP